MDSVGQKEPRWVSGGQVVHTYRVPSDSFKWWSALGPPMDTQGDLLPPPPPAGPLGPDGHPEKGLPEAKAGRKKRALMLVPSPPDVDLVAPSSCPAAAGEQAHRATASLQLLPRHTSTDDIL